MKVRCIDDSRLMYPKRGAIYTVLRDEGSYYTLAEFPDYGPYSKKYFQVVEEGASTSTKKYENVCPCGIHPSQCDYHRS